MECKRVILASASPRRRELMLQIGIEPVVIPSCVEEIVTSKEPSCVVEELSRQKAEDVALRCDLGDLVIGADTVVAVGGEILGKPKSCEEACRMIRTLAGTTHQVYTGVTIIQKAAPDSRTVTFFDCTDVEVYPMTEAEIRDYVSRGESMDKAGAYAVQGYFARYIKSLAGSYANVMGLPVSRLYQEMKGFYHD